MRWLVFSPQLLVMVVAVWGHILCGLHEKA
jgi:hypothetical protein